MSAPNRARARRKRRRAKAREERRRAAEVVACVKERQARPLFYVTVTSKCDAASVAKIKKFIDDARNGGFRNVLSMEGVERVEVIPAR